MVLTTLHLNKVSDSRNNDHNIDTDNLLIQSFGLSEPEINFHIKLKYWFTLRKICAKMLYIMKPCLAIKHE